MSLYGMMRTSVSGMAGQANRLSTVADNIANSGTTGYKRSRAEFSTLVVPNTPGSYNSGGINTAVQTAVSVQGVLQYTTSTTDLAVNGNGFFVVQDASGSPYLTRAGSFVKDDQGNLVNAAGFYLMGYSYANGTPAATVNGYDGLAPVNVSAAALTVAPTTQGVLVANLPAGAAIVPEANLPSQNASTATYSAKRSIVAYDNTGGQVLLDAYFTRSDANTWEVTVYDRDDATSGSSFPYSADPLATTTLTFGSNGQLTGNTNSITIPVPGGQSMALDMSGLTALSSEFAVYEAAVNGNGPSSIEKINISADGTLYATFSDGTFKPLYRIPLANVQSPDQLNIMSGNIYSESPESGTVRIGFPKEGALGSIVSGALESSNVELAEELTSMIESQRSYTANSKVFQTGSELMDILVNLKR